MLSGTSARRSRSGRVDPRGRGAGRGRGGARPSRGSRRGRRRAASPRRRARAPGASSPAPGSRSWAAGRRARAGRRRRRRAPAPAGRVAHEGEAAVVGHVEPLVAVGGDRVGALDARRPGGALAARAGRTGRRRRRRAARRRSRSARSAMAAIGSKSPAFTSPALATRIAGAAVERAQPRRAPSRSRRPAASRREPSDVGAADAEHRQRLHGARVDVAAGEDRGRRAGRRARASATSTPCRSPHQLPGRGQAGEVRHRRAGGEHAAEVGRQPEQLAQPADRDAPRASSRAARRPSRRRSGRSVEVSQSAPSAAGVAPPMTKWKKRGPARARRRRPAARQRAPRARRGRPRALLGQRPAEARQRSLGVRVAHRPVGECRAR